MNQRRVVMMLGIFAFMIMVGLSMAVPILIYLNILIAGALGIMGLSSMVMKEEEGSLQEVNKPVVDKKEAKQRELHIDYIRSSLEKEYSRKAIKEALLNAGYELAYIMGLFQEFDGLDVPPN